ncbi:tetratricopeptide repeat protein, partial [Muriicola sp.]|uniref:tetratricopeptide repeat protein n=1 Tax=Muriicola sp. TaxID=2020856 RepID=UPI003C7423B8
YTIAEQLLNEIFIDFPEDKETLLNLANLYLITKNSERAKSAYLQLVKNPLDSIVALNGIALASHIGKNDKEALNIARIARTKVATVNDSVLANQTNERYIQALIWNSKYREADKQIDSLEKSAPNQNWVKALRATLGMYTANFKSSLDSYDAILLNDSTSFDGNLGMANALFASDRIIPAYEAAYKTLSHYENQADAQGFVEKLNSLHTPMLEEKAFYTFDNGKNVAVGNQISGSLPFSTKFRTTFSYQFRNTENTISQNKATSHVVLAGAEYKVFPQTKLKTVIGFNNASFGDRSYTQPILDARFQLQPMRLQNLEIGYQREVQNFNADLIEREIVMNHYGLNYNVSSNFNLGWYTQLMHTRQTDGNTRNLIFTSLYYNVLKSPVLKVGVNYQYIAFKDQLPSIYFSPEQYHATEVFADIRGSFSEKTRYMLSGATGFQKVESDDQSAIFRIEAQLKHQFTNRLGVDLYGKYSNIASATAAGFEFTEIGIKVKWAITKAPLFNKKLLALK